MIQIQNNCLELPNHLSSLQKVLGGQIQDFDGEATLTFNSELGSGSVRQVAFANGMNYMEYKMTLKVDIILKFDCSTLNPLFFMYASQGKIGQCFSEENGVRHIEQFQSVILRTNSKDFNCLFIPKDEKIVFNNIIVNNGSFLEEKLKLNRNPNSILGKVFANSKEEEPFAFFGSINLLVSEQIKAINNSQVAGVTSLLQLEARMYIILSLVIQQYLTQHKETPMQAPVSQREMARIREIARKILAEPSVNYTLNDISREFGISQAKLQGGFKYLFKSTVTEFIRLTRLKAAKELMKTTDMNISEIVYSIGFTSRSYFSKIFREEFEMSPNQYRKHLGYSAVA